MAVEDFDGSVLNLVNLDSVILPTHLTLLHFSSSWLSFTLRICLLNDKAIASIYVAFGLFLSVVVAVVVAVVFVVFAAVAIAVAIAFVGCVVVVIIVVVCSLLLFLYCSYYYSGC